MFGWGEMGEDENERRKRERNVIFHYLVRVKRKSKENKVDRVLHPSPFFFLSKLGRKYKRKW